MKHVLTAALCSTLALTAVGTALAQEEATTPEAPAGPPAAFTRLDTDGDGTVTAADLEARAAERFAAADADGNGTLDAAELVAWREAREQERRIAWAEQRVARLDTDGDGVLSPEELPGAGEGPVRMLRMMDADWDGAVSADEFAAAHERIAAHHARGSARGERHEHGARDGRHGEHGEHGARHEHGEHHGRHQGFGGMPMVPFGPQSE
ncbi:EF-hand domain-containing protein [Tranquillimonas alkanivorans]|uniref:Ca2+-binding protein, EF-hand superfamily n=1 Tax=Tranquillimonas alkanivorans TaxID=441119 RepID=A0A1I5M1H9_9RHOB|nr:EF-hand domain-containing protein [Tranquillimonas alkanivorans]SFP03392.1 Ca2+-binding protein, EF-hand superfamily [Tranquillimonas alkanivorans]